MGINILVAVVIGDGVPSCRQLTLYCNRLRTDHRPATDGSECGRWWVVLSHFIYTRAVGIDSGPTNDQWLRALVVVGCVELF